jgi:3'(2'), 5'-bisphosphate nucleotidase
MFDLNASETKFAIQAVRQACRLVKLIQAEMVTPALTKEDRSPVTVADFASQALVGKLLEEAFPTDSLVVRKILGLASARENIRRASHPFCLASLLQPVRQVCDWIDRWRRTCQAFWTLDPSMERGHAATSAIALALIVDGRVQLELLGCLIWSMDTS